MRHRTPRARRVRRAVPLRASASSRPQTGRVHHPRQGRQVRVVREAGDPDPRRHHDDRRSPVDRPARQQVAADEPAGVLVEQRGPDAGLVLGVEDVAGRASCRPGRRRAEDPCPAGAAPRRTGPLRTRQGPGGVRRAVGVPDVGAHRTGSISAGAARDQHAPRGGGPRRRCRSRAPPSDRAAAPSRERDARVGQEVAERVGDAGHVAGRERAGRSRRAGRAR